MIKQHQKQLKWILQNTKKHEAKPILQGAKDVVKGITKPSWDEICALQPSSLLVRTEKACSNMVGTHQSWGNAKKSLKTLISNFLEFETRHIMNIRKANSVTGCLVQWLEAQLQYNEFLPN